MSLARQSAALQGETSRRSRQWAMEGPVMSNVKEADISELMRRNDAPLVELVDQWEQAYHAFVPAQAGKREGLVTRIEEIVGQIARYMPTTFPGLCSVLNMAHTILSVRDANADLYIAMVRRRPWWRALLRRLTG